MEEATFVSFLEWAITSDKVVAAIIVVVGSFLVASLNKIIRGRNESTSSKFENIELIANLSSSYKTSADDTPFIAKTAHPEEEKNDIGEDKGKVQDFYEYRHLITEAYASLHNCHIKFDIIKALQKVDDPSFAIKLYSKYHPCIGYSKKNEVVTINIKRHPFVHGLYLCFISLLFFSLSVLGGFFSTLSTKSDLFSQIFNGSLIFSTFIVGFIALLKAFDYMITTKGFLERNMKSLSNAR
ncbi:hypothetical protein [Psychrobium sp. 1_MG-2023]|uniref:hypothetical protein n=1 Tax=Psychrobium sp. 1_MG-2023 TaxID=3062624 RepID=UPI000C331DB8|nr:hypothetical protein [Psychrobium sp. 1_MG-2023]MDP2561416.1 hypothetical protein [Psychrobium sp. 1_MG-2023]PKF54896.1 hypothetical protein CW748_15225 [Alteromonadales bacterium alter-6D02]